MTTTFTALVGQEAKEGYGAYFAPVFEDEDGEAIHDVDAGIVRIAPDTVKVFPDGTVCVMSYDASQPYGIPLDLFEDIEDDLSNDDTHDLRNRWFATEEEAREHVEYTLERWNNPLPWESFVRL